MGSGHKNKRATGGSGPRTTLTPEDERRFKEYLDRWEQEVYQVLFKPRLIGRDAALIAWAHWVQPFPAITQGPGSL